MVASLIWTIICERRGLDKLDGSQSAQDHWSSMLVVVTEQTAGRVRTGFIWDLPGSRSDWSGGLRWMVMTTDPTLHLSANGESRNQVGSQVKAYRTHETERRVQQEDYYCIRQRMTY